MREKTKREIMNLVIEEIDGWHCIGIGGAVQRKIAGNLHNVSKELSERLSKIEAIVKADDYEFVTETKLVKKDK